MKSTSSSFRHLMVSCLAAVVAGFLLSGSPSVRAQEPAAPVTSPRSATTAPAVSADANPPAAPAKPTDAELRKRLTAEQYRVTCEAGTEPAFRNAYWNNHKAGIYVDVISGKALFSSLDKFDSGTGWPSFTKPLVKENVAQHNDTSFGMDRSEVVAKDSGAHLGHVFDDGPAATGGMRYCMNSASLRFIPVDKLKEEGYGDYLPIFEKAKGEKK